MATLMLVDSAVVVVTEMVVLALSQLFWNLFFVTVLLAGLLFVLLLAWRAHRAAWRERLRARQLQGTSTAEVARAAVQAERDQLSRDIEVWLRDLLGRVAERAHRAADELDPRASCVAIQVDAQRGTSELRRQLGLLRPFVDEAGPAGTATDPVRQWPSRGDAAVAALVVAVAVTEMSTYGGPLVGDVTVGSAVVTVAGAATTVARGAWPVAGALTCSALLVAGSLVGRPVYDGFWFPLATGLLAWALVGLHSRSGWLTLLVFLTAVLVSRWLYVPDNVLINALCLGVVVVTSAVVARSRRLRVAAHAAASARTDQLEHAAVEAVQAERLQVARELHDVMSHAVSVIAVQAGAAELLWPSDPAAARRAIAVVESIAGQTAEELDRLLPGRLALQHTTADVDALVARMRAAGLQLDVRQEGEPRSELISTIYRIVQECLTNALRYARNGAVQLSITVDDDSQRTTVQVSSQGPPAPTRADRGYGLIGLEERVAQMGGALQLDEQPESGVFEVCVVFPGRRVETL